MLAQDCRVYDGVPELVRSLAVTTSHPAGALAAADLVVPALAGLTVAELRRRIA